MRPQLAMARGLLGQASRRFKSTQKAPSGKGKSASAQVLLREPLVRKSDLFGDAVAQGSKAEKVPLDAATVRPVKPERQRVDFIMGGAGPSMERKEFFASVDDIPTGPVAEADEIPGIETGRVVEARRSGYTTIGLVIAPLLIGGRHRLLILRPNGELWPVSPSDVLFSMPASLVPAEVAKACWSPELLGLWAEGHDIGLSGTSDEANLIGEDRAKEMVIARRRAAGILRRVQRETERMSARLLSGTLEAGRGGGVDAIWDRIVPQDPDARGSITSAELAELLLNSDTASQEGTKRITVRPNTLPAFAAHGLMAERSDLFQVDLNDHWDNGRFLARSRNELRRLQTVAHAARTEDPALIAFADKVKLVRELLQAPNIKPSDLPEWTPFERDVIAVLSLPFFETRSVQTYQADPIVASIAKTLGGRGLYVTDERIDTDLTHKILVDIGVLAIGDSLRGSVMREHCERAMVIGGVSPDTGLGESSMTPTATDMSLDSLRTEFSDRVYVIDDASAVELDDGISLERVGDDDFWVHVHVADPTRFIERDSDLATRASFFATSMYFPEGTFPLLPESLGGGKLSLGEGGDNGQASMVLSARLDRQGNLRDYKVRMGWTKDAKITTYAAVNEALGISMPAPLRPFGHLARSVLDPPPSRKHTTLSDSDKQTLTTLHELATAVRAKRYATSGVEWEVPHADVGVLNTPRPSSTLFHASALPAAPQIFAPRTWDEVQYAYSVPPRIITEKPTANYMVAEFMILANAIAARWSGERGIPMPFRGTAPIRDTSMTPAHLCVDKLLASRPPGTGLVDSYDIKAAQLEFPRTEIKTTPVPHWVMGMGDTGYVRVTSPLRRYEDMLAHWQLKGALAAEAGLDSPAAKLLDHDTVLALAKRADRVQTRAKFVSRAATQYWYSGIFTQRRTGPLPAGYVYDSGQLPVDLNAPLDARCNGQETAGVDFKRVPVYIPALGLDIDLILPMHSRALEVGQEVKVRLDNVQQWPNPSMTCVPA